MVNKGEFEKGEGRSATIRVPYRDWGFSILTSWPQASTLGARHPVADPRHGSRRARHQHNSHHFRWVRGPRPLLPGHRPRGALLAHLVILVFPHWFPGTKCQRELDSFLQTRRYSHRVCGSGSPRPLPSGDSESQARKMTTRGRTSAATSRTSAPSTGPEPRPRCCREIRPGPTTRHPCTGWPSDAGTVEGPT